MTDAFTADITARARGAREHCIRDPEAALADIARRAGREAG
jgi:hypothetical protein